MAEKNNFDLMVRLSAIEFILVELLAREYEGTANPLQTAKRHSEGLKESFSKVGLPGLDPATSELWVGGIEDEIMRLLEKARQRVEQNLDGA